jgi:hypothetical protein
VSTKQPQEPGPVPELCDFLRRILDASEPPTRAQTSDPVEAVVLGTLLRGRELAAGVVSELHAGRGRNAMPLARHLFEEYLQLSYILDDPGPRFAPPVERRDGPAAATTGPRSSFDTSCGW